MKRLRLRGSARPETCSADTVVPRMTNRSTPAPRRAPISASRRSTEVNAIASQLYCPVCESTPLDVCPTEACRQWRDVIRTMLTEGNRRLGRHDRIHRGCDHRQIEVIRVDLPTDRDLLGVARATRGHHGDVVEGVGTPPALASADLDLVHAGQPSCGGVRDFAPSPGGDQTRRAADPRDPDSGKSQGIRSYHDTSREASR